MNGKEKLLDRIKSDCDATIATIEQKTNAECDRILDKAKAQIEQNDKEYSAKVLAKLNQINAGTKSKLELEIRNAILKKRRSEIDSTVKIVYDHLLNLDDNEYFNAVYRLAAQLRGMRGVVFLNKKDLDRLPSDFENKLKENGLDAELSKDAVNIDGGFILKNGDVEENMSFSAIFSARQDELEDLINRELFAQ